MKITSKKSQAEVITTVLLILIGIIAVIIVAGVVINFIRDRLVVTACFDTTDQFTINLESEFTYHNSSSGKTYVSISRGPSKSFNLTGLLVSVGNSQEMNPYTIIDGKNTTGVKMYGGTTTLSLPGPGGRKTYEFTAGVGNATLVEIAPIIDPGGQCRSVDKKTIPVYS